MTILVGAMSLSSRYETSRSRILSLADEEEEREGDEMVKNGCGEWENAGGKWNLKG